MGLIRCVHRETNARLGRCRTQPLGGRLAGGHQRHARLDRVQLTRRRLLLDHRGPCANAHPVGGGGARRTNSQVHQPRLLGNSWHQLPGGSGGSYPAKWFNPEHKKDAKTPRKNTTACGAKPRPWPLPTPCATKPATVTEESKPTTKASPGLFDLTSLQREANGRFGFSAKTTLALGAKFVRTPQGPDLPTYRFTPLA